MNRPPCRESSQHDGPERGALRAVGLVTAREIRARMASPGYVTGLLFTVVAVVGLLFAVDGAQADKDHTIAVAGPASGALHSPGPHLHQRTTGDAAEARALTEDGTVDAALVLHDGRAELLLRGNTPDSVREGASAMVRDWTTDRTLRAQGVDPEATARAIAAAGPHSEVVTDGADSGALGSALGVTLVLFFQVFGAGMAIAQGVVEEKSTRVVELLLTTLSPLRLMTGKVLGIGVSALTQTAVLAVTVIAAQRLGGLDSLPLPGAATMVGILGWFALSFFFYAFLFAAAGSLVSRPEDLQSVIMPVMMASMAPMVAVIAAGQDLTASWVSVLRYVPPLSGLLMPLEATVGDVGPGSQLLAVVPMAVAILLAATLCGSIYRRSILHAGTPLRWSQALTGAKRIPLGSTSPPDARGNARTSTVYTPERKGTETQS